MNSTPLRHRARDSKSRYIRILVILLTTSTTLLAASVWEKLEFTEWPEKQVQRLLSNSPWSQKVTLSLKGGVPGSREDTVSSAETGGREAAQAGGPQFGGGGQNASRTGLGSRGGAYQMDGRPVVTVFVRWISALPVKQALLMARYGAEASTAEQAQSFLTREESHYVISVSQLPAYLGQEVKTSPEPLIQGSTLIRKNKEPLHPDDIQLQARGDGASDLLLLFPRTKAITLDDRKVELIIKAERFELKRTFKLKDMVYRGELAL